MRQTAAMAVALAAGLALIGLAGPRVGRLWLNTVWLAGGACLLALPIGTLLAVVLYKTDAPGRGVAMWLLVGMLFVPLYLVTGAWDAGFGIQGWHTLSANPHLAHEPWLAGWRAAVWVHGLASVPWVVLIVGVGLRAVEAELEEDAATCASPAKVLWYVSTHRAAPSIGVAAVWIATVVMTEISVTDFFQVRSFAEEVYTQAALGTNVVAGGVQSDPFSAIGIWSGIALSAVLAWAVLVAASRLLADLADVPQRRPWIWRLKLARRPAAIALGAIMLLLVGVPLGNLVYKAGVHVLATDGGRVRMWTPWKAIERVGAAPGEFAGELWLSAYIGAAAATGAVLIAIPLAWSLRGAAAQSSVARMMCGWRWLGLFFVALCLTIPGPLLGLGTIHLLNQSPDSPFSGMAWLYDSSFAPWLVQVVRALPIATLVLWQALAGVPQVMLDTAATDGCGWWGRLLKIALPQRWPAVAGAWLIALAVAVGELAATVLVMPPTQGATALSMRVFQYLHFGVDDRVAAICLVMVAAIAAITGIAAALLKRKDGWVRR
jgi:iron(III) transport system permease protein